MTRPILGLIVFLVAITATAQDTTSKTNAACEICETPFHKVTTAPKTFLRGAYEAAIPSLDGYFPQKLVEKPMVLNVVVDSSGVPCRITASKNPEAEVLSRLSRSMRSWKFKTPKYNGKDICLASQVLVYVRKVDGQPEIFIPGLSNESKK